MAMKLRQEHRLSALRLSLTLSRSEPARVRFEPFHGREALAEPLHLPAADLGIRPVLDPEAYARPHFSLPQSIEQTLAALLPAAVEGGALWLQIERSSGHLAVVPWERLLLPRMRLPILRVPNFLVEPNYLEGRLVLAICASSPRAKTPFSVVEYTERLVEQVQDAVAQGSIVHVFADSAAFGGLGELAQRSHGRHVVEVHDPAEAASFGDGRRHSTEEGAGADEVASPWLRWIRHRLGGRRLDAAHFLCPGYFSGDRGALALAPSPVSNTDPHWSHFVGASELARFLNLTGAWSVAFSPPHGDVWALGLRLLGERLAWERPGPVLLHESGHGHDGALRAAYAFLYGREPAAPPTSGAIGLWCHPRRVGALAGTGREVSVTAAGSGREEDAGEMLEGLLPPRPSRAGAATATPGSQPTWKVASRLGLDQAALALGERVGAARAGGAAAIQLLNELLEETSSPSDTAAVPELGRYLRTSDGQSAAARIRSSWSSGNSSASSRGVAEGDT